MSEGEDDGVDHEHDGMLSTTEASDDEEEGPSGDFYDVLDILDGRTSLEADDSENPILPVHESSAYSMNSATNAVGEQEITSITSRVVIAQGHSDIALEDTDDEELAIQKLDRFVDDLDAEDSKRKLIGNDNNELNQRPSRRRKLHHEQTQAGVENEFNTLAGYYITN